MTTETKKKINISLAQENVILRKIVDITNSELHLNLVLDEIIKVIDELIVPDSIFIYLNDERRKKLTLLASKIPHKKELGIINIKTGEGITGWVAKNAKTVAINRNAYQDPRFKSFDVLPEDSFEAFLAVPIVNKGKVIGVINSQHKEEHVYAKRTMSLIELIAKQIGGVIVNAKLYDESKKKALQFEQLNKVSKSITSENYLEEILNLIVVVTAEMLNSDICSIMLLDKKGKELIIKATQSLSDEYIKKPNLKVDETISGEVVRTKKPISIENVMKDERYRHKELAEKEGLISMLAVPMIIKGKAMGIINVYTKSSHVFVKEEIDVLQMVANQAAVAVENTNLVKEAIKSKEALETRKTIERAKGILMKMNNFSEQEAYSMIHKKSMNSRKSMKEIAESILLLNELKE